MSDDEPSATEAFEQLRAEVALLRRAIEGLAAAAVETAAPDYSPTLAGLRKVIDGVGKRVEALAGDPPVASNQMAARITAVAAHARNEGQRELAQAKGALEKGVRDLVQAAGAVRAVRTDRRRLVMAAVGGVLAGIGLWTSLSGPIARALPETWQAPERLAAATLVCRGGMRAVASWRGQMLRHGEISRRLATWCEPTPRRSKNARRNQPDSVAARPAKYRSIRTECHIYEASHPQLVTSKVSGLLALATTPSAKLVSAQISRAQKASNA